MRSSRPTLTSPAFDVCDSNRVAVDGKPLPDRAPTRLFRYHKERGFVTSHKDDKGRPTVFERMPPGLPRVISVGRLDLNSEGLLLLTNDGALARALELPKNAWLRRYRVRVHCAVDPARLEALRDGAVIDGVAYGPIEAALDRVQGANAWITVGLREGKNREIRKAMAHLGLDVTRLIRIAYGPFELGDLPRGAAAEIPRKLLREKLGVLVKSDENRRGYA